MDGAAKTVLVVRLYGVSFFESRLTLREGYHIWNNSIVLGHRRGGSSLIRLAEGYPLCPHPIRVRVPFPSLQLPVYAIGIDQLS